MDTVTLPVCQCWRYLVYNTFRTPKQQSSNRHKKAHAFTKGSFSHSCYKTLCSFSDSLYLAVRNTAEVWDTYILAVMIVMTYHLNTEIHIHTAVRIPVLFDLAIIYCVFHWGQWDILTFRISLRIWELQCYGVICVIDLFDN